MLPFQFRFHLKFYFSHWRGDCEEQSPTSYSRTMWSWLEEADGRVLVSRTRKPAVIHRDHKQVAVHVYGASGKGTEQSTQSGQSLAMPPASKLRKYM